MLLAHLSRQAHKGELIVYPCSGVRRRRCCCCRRQDFKHLLLFNRLPNQSQIFSHYKKIGYNINVLQHTECLVVISIMVGNFAFLFNCTPVGRTSDSMTVPT